MTKCTIVPQGRDRMVRRIGFYDPQIKFKNYIYVIHPLVAQNIERITFVYSRHQFIHIMQDKVYLKINIKIRK